MYYWKGLFTQAELFAKTFKTCQHFKNRNTIYGYLPPKNIAEIKSWGLVHVDLIDSYRKSIIQQHPFGATIQNNASMT